MKSGLGEGLVRELGELSWWAVATIGEHINQGSVLLRTRLLHLATMVVLFNSPGCGWEVTEDKIFIKYT